MMNQDIKAKWVAALRSGDYVQGRGALRVDNKFCCLGVLCNIHAQDHPEVAAMQQDRNSYMGKASFPHKKVSKWADLEDCGDNRVSINGISKHLAEHNDNGRTFLEIADAIESQL